MEPAGRNGRRMGETVLALLLALVVALPWSKLVLAQGDANPAPTFKPEELEQLAAPIALYPDALVAQILPASTQPLQVVEAAQAIAEGGRPSQATASQWDPAVQALLSFPSVLKMMNDKLDWTTRLGQAVVTNQGAVMAAIQRVRQQAQAAGNLQSTSQQVVETQGSTIIIEPANPQYIYVPQYNPVTILSPVPYYGYPAMTFGVGFAAGAATAYACSWGSYGSYGSVTVNNNYHYNYSNSYEPYHSASGSYSTYHPQSGTYSGYNSRTGTYGAYNPSTGKYATYNPSTGAYDKNGQTRTYHPPSSTSEYHGDDSMTGWSGQSHDTSGSGDAFHGAGGGGWGAQDASSRGADSFGGRSFGGGGGWGGGGGFDRGGGGFGRGGGFGGGFGGFRGGGFGGRR